jgi:hypothetical protein
VAVTANRVVAVSLEASAPVKVWAPTVAAGIVNLQLKLPRAFEVVVHATPAAQLTVTAELAAYPVPVYVTGVPTGPVTGVVVSWGPTENVAPSESLSASVAVNVAKPTVVCGTVNSQLKLPPAVVVPEQTGPFAHETVIVERPAKPVALNMTVSPTVPDDGVMVSTGPTRNVVVAVFDPESVAVNA